MLKAYVSCIIFDRGDVRLSVSTSFEALRQDLVEFVNDNADDSDQEIPSDSTIAETQDYLNSMGWGLVVEETVVFGDAA